MNQSNRFIESMSLTCVLINIGLFLFASVTGDNTLQILSLFNIACFFFYFLILGRK